MGKISNINYYSNIWMFFTKFNSSTYCIYSNINPPLISVMNKLKLDRRAMACSLTFSLKAPYIAIPAGFGLIFQGIIATQMTENGMPVNQLDVWKSTWILGLFMVFVYY